MTCEVADGHVKASVYSSCAATSHDHEIALTPVPM